MHSFKTCTNFYRLVSFLLLSYNSALQSLSKYQHTVYSNRNLDKTNKTHITLNFSVYLPICVGTYRGH